MKKALIITILALSSSAVYADCTSLTATGQRSPGQTTLVKNICAYPIQVELRGNDGGREMMFLDAFASQTTGTGGDGALHAFACPTPKHPSQDPRVPITVQADTVSYYCIN